MRLTICIHFKVTLLRNSIQYEDSEYYKHGKNSHNMFIRDLRVAELHFLPEHRANWAKTLS